MVLFIDEIHRLHRSIEEIMYRPWRIYTIVYCNWQGTAARTLQIDLPPFTLIGATPAGLAELAAAGSIRNQLSFGFLQSA